MGKPYSHIKIMVIPKISKTKLAKYNKRHKPYGHTRDN